MDPVEPYLAELRDIRASGAAVPETSGYGALATLLSEVGSKLKPRVRCLIDLQNPGVGIPDGLFAAWVVWAERHSPTDAQARFRWREPAGYLHILILQKLFYDFSQPGPLGVLRTDEVLDWAAEALNRVDRTSFFATFEQSHAVQYMVARVETVLREELDIADGLADPRVVVLDQCCGTGAYLVEVLNKIAATLAEKSDGVDALAARETRPRTSLRATTPCTHWQVRQCAARAGPQASACLSDRALPSVVVSGGSNKKAFEQTPPSAAVSIIRSGRSSTPRRE